MEKAKGHRVLLVSENPAEAQLLQIQLDAEIQQVEVVRVWDEESLLTQLESGTFALLVVDLPMPEPTLDLTIARVQADRPRLKVLFRWSSGGLWNYADGSEPLAGIVRQTLRIEAHGTQDPEARRRMLDRLVRGQEVLLRLAQTDFWDFEAGLRQVAASVARLMKVERVSVWELDESHEHLRCLDLYELAADRHSHPGELSDFPHYLKALSSSLMVAAHDAREDPRTSEFREGYLVPLGITSVLDAPIRGRGRVRGVICLEHVGPQRVWDVLEQCHAASAANLLGHAFEMRDRRHAEEALRESEHLSSIGNLAARLAHDFNNRLLVIGAALERTLTPEQARQEPWSVIEEELEKARKTARNLMSLNRKRVEVPVPVALADVLKWFQPTLEHLVGPRITLELDPGSKPLPVAILAAEFEQAILNLATNARDAMPREGRLRVALEGVGTPRRHARLVVEDTGIGMDEDTRLHLFEPFFTTKDSTRGSGLGLASVLAVVQEAGGTVQVASRPGKGTRVVIELPLA